MRERRSRFHSRRAASAASKNYMNDQPRQPEHLSDRLKGLPSELENLQLEQLPPNKPSFLLVVILAGVALIIVFIVAIFVLHLDGGRLFNHHQKHATSQLVLPSARQSG
jgi:hypothetical protein